VKKSLMETKKVLVTGADGFIGSHLVDNLLSRGYPVRALAQYNSFNSIGWLDQIQGAASLEVISGDVRDQGFCHELTDGVAIVFNLAALIAIPYSYSAPQSYLDTNVMGALNIAKSCLHNSVEKLVQISTSEVYGSAQYVPIDEKHPLQPQSPYSASKIASDALVQSFHNSFGLNAIIARPFNTFGPRQSARAVIPSIISQIADGVKTIKVGDLRPTRDFNFVDDTCDGLIALAECDEAIGQVVNIGSGLEISIEDTFKKIRKIMGSSVQFEVEKIRLRPEKSEVNRLCCDSTLLKSLTGFENRISLDTGLKKTIDWFLDPRNLIKYDSYRYNV